MWATIRGTKESCVPRFPRDEKGTEREKLNMTSISTPNPRPQRQGGRSTRILLGFFWPSRVLMPAIARSCEGQGLPFLFGHSAQKLPDRATGKLLGFALRA